MKKNIITLLGCSLLLSACGGDSSGSGSDAAAGDSVSYSSKQINAASYSDWVYFDLSSGEIPDFSAGEAAASADWDIAFRRYDVMLNGGASGPGHVAGAVADAQDEFYAGGEADASVFTNAVADNYVDDLDGPYDLSSLTFVTDSNEAVIDGWYVYDMTTHTISANTSVGWLLRHADGESYSKFTLISASYSGVSVSYETQAADTVQFAGGGKTISAVIADGETAVCLDFDSEAVVSCDSAAWDLRYEIDMAARQLAIWTNGGVYGDGNGAAFGSVDAIELASYTSATTLDSTSIVSLYSQDASAGIFSAYSWWEYGLAGGHKIWPNFRTYVIDTDTSDENSEKYTLQIVNYYSLGASGSPEIRYQLITEDE